MAKRIPEEKFQAIEAIVSMFPDGTGIREITNKLDEKLPRRTLQYRLKHLVDEGRLLTDGEKRGVKYRLPAERAVYREVPEKDAEPGELLSEGVNEIRKYIRQPIETRKRVGYDRKFLDSYLPNTSFYLSEKEREHLRKIGTQVAAEQPAGAHAKQILNRLLIDISWNSSRLEGNTYSLLETSRLINFGKEAEGKDQLEAQMILNHKEAIEFLVDSAAEIGFNRYTIFNLHALLAHNLLADPKSIGKLRRIAVGIGKTAFRPLETPQLIDGCFDQLLASATAIKDPFEQSFFMMVQIPYLQPFDDVNKRLSRLAANIPLIRENLMPLSFIEVPTDAYTEAVLGVYELKETSLLKNIFFKAYESSASRYRAVRQVIGEPDQFRIKHREGLFHVVREIIRASMDRKSAFEHIEDWVKKNIEFEDRETFREIAENELIALHEGSCARYKVTLLEFQEWQEVWNKKSL